MTDVVQQLWGFCHTLRHEGVDYGDYIEQITYLLFIKMADERAVTLPSGCDWATLRNAKGVALLERYEKTLRKLGQQPGVLGDIFAGSLSRFSNPVSLKKLLNGINATDWTSLNIDIKAAAFEGLLERAASEGKKGAGQYFTPRILIRSIVRCLKPDPRVRTDFTVMDPAAGTGGFLVAAYEWLMEETNAAVDRKTAKRLHDQTYFGQELVPRPRRLALMNLFLHGLEPDIRLGDSIYDPPDGRRFDVVLTNPPFGVRGANDAPERDDFTVATSNKQLNFIQHVLTILKPGGRAGVVLPDNALFADQAGEVFEILTKDCDVHTVVRLPNGTFTPYSPGTKTNVIFFVKGRPTEIMWVYDARTNVPRVTKRDRPLTEAHFADFEKCYGKDPNGRSKRRSSASSEDRWRDFHIDEIKEREYKIDSLRWIRDESLDDWDTVPEPEEVANELLAELRGAMDEINLVLSKLALAGDPADDGS